MSTGALVRFKKSSAESAAPKSQGDTLRVNTPGDRFEQEADHAAEQVVSGATRRAAWLLSRMGPQSSLQRECFCGGTCDDCKHKKEEVVQRDARGGAKTETAPRAVHDVLRGRGQEMEPGTRSFMESRFGHSFSNVRIFNDETAAHSASSVAANAFTVGEKIVFNKGRYAPDSEKGRKLLAHELAHVVQQQGAAQSMIQRDESEEDVVEEGEQEKKSDTLMSRAIRAADARRWQEAARLANGLSPQDLKSFIFIYKKNPQFVKQLHIGAAGAAGVGEKSAVALATEETYKDVKKKEEIQYQHKLAKENGTPPPKEDGTPSVAAPKPLTVQDKLAQCRSGESKNLMTFPLRMPKGMWRISVAPVSAKRSGNDIIVSQPVNAVLGDPMFRREVKTLPLNTFLGGVHLAPDDVVRVRVYDDDEKIICVTGEQMMKISDATDTAVLTSILGTVLDAATIMAPGVGQGLSRTASVALGVGNIAMGEGLDVVRQNAAVNAGLQEKIDWAQIGFETLLQLVTLKYGGKLVDSAVERLFVQTAGKYERPILKLAVESALQGSIAGFHAAANAVFNRLRGSGKPVTVGQFLEEVAAAFAQGTLMHAITSAAGSHNESESHAGARSANAQEHASAPVRSQENASAPHHDAPHAHEGSAAKPAAKAHSSEEKHVTSVPKEEAKAVEQVGNGHEVVVTKDGIGRCSPSPCPVIHVEYAKELKAQPELQGEYDAVQKLRKTNPKEASKQAAELVRKLDTVREGMRVMGTPEEWKAAVNQWGDTLEDHMSQPKVTGGESGRYVEGTKIPSKPKPHVDMNADPKDQDVSLPKRPGETGREAVARVKKVVGKKISDIPELAKLWNDAKVSVLSRRALTSDNYATLYDATRNAFWARVGGKSPEAIRAQQILADAGFGVTVGKARAPKLDGVSGEGRSEVTLSLDHLQEKAIGNNWKKALDADNLQMEFAMPNSDREIRQSRHPELRPGNQP